MPISKVSYIKLLTGLPLFAFLSLTSPLLLFSEFALGYDLIKPSKYGALFICSIISIYPLSYLLAILIRAFFFNGLIIYCKSGKICYLSSILKSVPVSDVKIVSIKKINYGIYKLNSIQFELSNGKTKYIPIALSRESPEIIVERVGNIINTGR